jgi:hypothetical protein
VAEDLQHEDLRVRITPSPDGYRVEVTAADGSHAGEPFVPPFDDDELEDILRRFDPVRVRGRWNSPVVDDAKAWGTRLASALFVGEVRDVYQAAKARAEAQRRGVRISLALTDVPELMDVPWEVLYERPGFLAASERTPVVRALDLKEVRNPEPVTGPLRILGIVSLPRGAIELDATAEKARLRRALGGLIREGRVALEWLSPPTLGKLEERLAGADDIHVIHFIGHGEYEERREGGVLVFEDRRGRERDVSGEELCAVLRDEWALRLAVLNACEGARTSRVDPFSGVASSLLECGIPAIVAMQFSITDAAAIHFARRFYTLVAEGYPIDSAVARTRAALLAEEFGSEFATPVLFLRGHQTRLFDTKTSTPGPEAKLTSTQAGKQRPSGAVGVDAPAPKKRSAGHASSESGKSGSVGAGMANVDVVIESRPEPAIPRPVDTSIEPLTQASTATYSIPNVPGGRASTGVESIAASGGEPGVAGEPPYRTRVLREGETLETIASEEYGDVALWRGIAAFNDIEDPMRVEAGLSLLIPPLAEARLMA